MTCKVIYNNELILNNSHTNNYIFVLDRVPTSFLISKFSKDALIKVDATIGSMSNSDVIRESNQDVQNLALFTQTVNLPEMDLGFSDIPTQFATIHEATGLIDFGELSTTFLNDENWFIYKMLTYWLLAGHNPEKYNKRNSVQHWKDFYVNAYLIILNNNREKIMEFKFTDVHPKTMGSIELKDSEASRIMLPVTWKYTDYVISDDLVITRV